VFGPTDDIAFDPELSAKWDYEAEAALVIGRDGRSILRGSKTLLLGVDLRVQAARSYSLMSPPRTGRRLIRCRS
jgi:hypothetical protein